MPGPSDPLVIRLIGVFKAVKGLLSLTSGLGLLSILKHGLVETVSAWIAALHVDAEARWLQRALAAISGIPAGTWRLFAAVCFLYAALCLIEGFGLWRQRRWAEWLTVVSSSLLVPVEVYELVERPTATKAVILAVNLAIVAYLARHIHAKARRRVAGGDP